jgi:hypothetical protein
LKKDDFTSRHICDRDFDGIVRSDKSLLRAKLDELLMDYLNHGGKITR